MVDHAQIERQAAIVIVGNEVLSGDVIDHNGTWLSRELTSLGVEVGIALMLPDVEFVLAEYLREVGARYAPVFVTGGIGTTLDDVTRHAVARAAGVPLVVREDVVEHLERLAGRTLTSVQRRLAELPQGCELIPNRIGRAPGFSIGPFVVFPGVPEMLHDMFPLVAERYRRPPAFKRILLTDRRESEIAMLLEELAQRAPGVAIGSYPKKDETRSWVEIVLKSRDATRLQAAAGWLAERLPGQPVA
jgi:molybdopterin-biosynthesis enzyme MoeA-like protein